MRREVATEEVATEAAEAVAEAVAVAEAGRWQHTAGCMWLEAHLRTARSAPLVAEVGQPEAGPGETLHALQHGQSATLGGAPTRLLHPFRARLVALCSSALPG